MLTILILACVGGDPADTADTASEPAPEPLECNEPAGAWPLQAGSWTVLTETAISLGCENAAGNGMHVHVGEENPFIVTEAEPGCVDVDASGMPMEGTHDGETFTLRGSVELEYGICLIRLSAVTEGVMTAADAFTYRTDATLEPLDESCEIMVGDTNKHTFPALPCDWAWDGQGWLP